MSPNVAMISSSPCGTMSTSSSFACGISIWPFLSDASSGQTSSLPYNYRFQTGEELAYEDLRDWIAALERAGELKTIRTEVDPVLEITEITDRVSKNVGAGVP